jgi:hypothetical protein
LAIECRRDLLKLDQVVGEETSQALVEGEINVPESKAPVAKVLDINGKAIISSREVIQDKVMVEGIIRYDVLYVPEGETAVDAVDVEVGFTQYLDIPGVKPKMASRLKLDVEHIDYELVSGRRINAKAVLNLYGQVSQVTELEAVREFTDLDDVEVLRDHVRAATNAGAGHSQTMVREDLELSDSMPSVLKVLRKDARVKVHEKKVADNKVVVHGDVDVKLLYLCDDEEEPVQFIEHTIPFSHFVDIAGAYQGMDCTADVHVNEFYADPRENINNELRIIDAELVLSLDAQVLEPQEGEILVDAYSPSVPMTLKKRKIKLQQFVGETQGQTVVKESIPFPEGAPKARRILYADAAPTVTDERIEAGKVILEGILSAQVVYQTNDAAMLIGSFREDIPFRHALDMEGVDSRMDCQSEAAAEHVSFTLLAQDEVELKIAVLCKTSVNRTIEKDVIIGADEAEKAASRGAGIYIYFVQPGDNLWAIAKKYNTTITNILKYNTLEEESKLAPGSKLMIFKKLETNVV